jgi:hypothetical protein
MPQSATTFKGSVHLRRGIEHHVGAGVRLRGAGHAVTATAIVLATVSVITNLSSPSRRPSPALAAAIACRTGRRSKFLSDWEED